jgi:hypothetical protein
LRRSIRVRSGALEEARGDGKAQEVLVERAGERVLVLQDRGRARTDGGRVRLVQADELGQLPDVPLEIRSRGYALLVVAAHGVSPVRVR